jgi:hypothetical protein
MPRRNRPEQPEVCGGYVVAGRPGEELRALHDLLLRSARDRQQGLMDRTRKGQASAEAFAERELSLMFDS